MFSHADYQHCDPYLITINCKMSPGGDTVSPQMFDAAPNNQIFQVRANVPITISQYPLTPPSPRSALFPAKYIPLQIRVNKARE